MYINNFDANDLIDAVAEALAYGYDADTYTVEDATYRAIDEGLVSECWDSMITYDDDIWETWNALGCPEPSEFSDGIVASMRFAIAEKLALHEEEIAEEAAQRGSELTSTV